MRHVRQDQGDAQDFWRDEDYPNTAYRFTAQTSNATDVFIGSAILLRRNGASWIPLTPRAGENLGLYISGSDGR